MKILNGLIVLIFAFSIISCSNDDSQKKTGKPLGTGVVKNTKSADKQSKPYELPKMDFDETDYDFGKIIQGEKIAYDYHFVNSGKGDLVISRVSTSCGCTVGNYPKKPVKPGEKAKIEVVFDSKGKKGFQNKTITVLANTEPNSTMLHIKGVVAEPEKN